LESDDIALQQFISLGALNQSRRPRAKVDFEWGGRRFEKVFEQWAQGVASPDA